MAAPVRLLLCAADPREIKDLPTAMLDGEEPVGAGGWRVWSRVVGIGLVDAALGTMQAIAEVHPTRIVLLGTCGVFAGARAAGAPDVAVPSQLLLVAGDVARGDAALLGPSEHEADLDLVQALGGPTPGVATTLGISTDDELARRLEESSGCGYEHLEAFAVVAACQRAGVPAAVVLGVANRVGASGRAEWRANEGEASRRAVERVLGWIERGC